MIGEFLFHLLFKEKDRFLWFEGVFALLWDLWGEEQ